MKFDFVECLTYAGPAFFVKVVEFFFKEFVVCNFTPNIGSWIINCDNPEHWNFNSVLF